MMTHPDSVFVHLRAATAGLCTLLLALFLTPGCAGLGSAADADAPVRIDIAEQSIRVENRAGVPLVNIRVSLFVQRGVEFTKVLPSLGDAQTREIRFYELVGRDGSRFSRMSPQPKTVRLLASDAGGRSYELEMPWK